MSYGVVQVIIDESSPRIINGTYQWERDNNGVLIAPSGSSFPVTPEEGEVFWRTDENKFYRRNDANTAWEAVESAVLLHHVSHENGGTDEINVGGLSGLLADPQTPVSHTHTESEITDLDHYDSTDFNSDFSSKDTDDLTEGTSNLYYTDARVSANSDVSANTSARHSHSNKTELDLVTDGDHDIRTDNPHGITTTQIGAIPTSEKGAANGVATLDSGSKIPVSQIPSISLPEVFIVADAAARLALTVQEGDEAIQSDDNSQWIYDGTNWHKRPSLDPFSNIVTVAKSGGQFTSIKDAIDSITTATSTNKFSVLVYPGDYTELPITMKEWVNVTSTGGTSVTKIIASTTGSNLITSPGNNTLSGFTLTGTTGAALINFGTAGASFFLIDTMLYNAQTGINVSNGYMSITKIFGLSVSGSVTTFINITNNAQVLIESLYTFPGAVITTLLKMNGSNTKCNINSITSKATMTTGIDLDNGAVLDIVNYMCRNCTTGVKLNNASRIDISVPNLDETITTHFNIQDLLSDVYVIGGKMIGTRMVYPAGYNHDISLFQDRIAKSIEIDSKLRIGRPDKGRDCEIGRGAPYTQGMLVITTDNTATSTSEGGNLTNVSDDAASDTGSTFSFQGTTSNHTILISTQAQDATDVLKILSLRIDQTIAAVESTKRSFALEYWDGSSWTELPVMAVCTDHLHRYANEIFIRSGQQEDIFYTSPADWTKKTISSNSLYWLRFRITDNLTTSPVFERLQLGTSRTRFTENGLQAFYGLAQFKTTLLSAGNIFGESGGVTNDSESVGSGGVPTGWNHKVKNSVMNGNGDAIYLQMNLPRGICTSCPLQIQVNYSVIYSGSSSDGRMIISALPVEIAGVMAADPAGGIDTIARTLANTETLTSKQAQTSTHDIHLSTINKIISVMSTKFDISNYYEGDMTFVRVEYDDDGSANKDIFIWSVELIGTMWTNGEKL